MRCALLTAFSDLHGQPFPWCSDACLSPGLVAFSHSTPLMITNPQLPLPSRSHASFLRNLCFAGALALATLAGGTAQSQTTFTPGDVFAGENDPNALTRVPLASEGGTEVTAFAGFPAYNAGQIAWSQDLTTAYATVFSADSVIQVSPTGIVSGFATVSGATGIAVLPDGRVLCGSYNTNQILDVTAGGAGPFPVYASVSGPRNLLVTSAGTLFVVSQNNQQILDLTVPGSPVVFATLPSSPTEVIELADGRMLASVYGNLTVVDITEGGTFLPGESVFASERAFMGLAQDATGRILANVLGVTGIWDITNGGNFASVAATYTTAGDGESMLDSVPGGLGAAGPPKTAPLLPAKLELSRVPRFMPTLVGRQSRPLPVRATNRGEEPLRILSMRFSGKAAREFRILRSGATTIQPGATMVVRAVFAPRRSGARRAVLTVRSTGGTRTAKVSGLGRSGGSPLTRYPLRPHRPR